MIQMTEKTQEMTDLEDRKSDAEAPALDDIKGCVGATGGAESTPAGSALPPEESERLNSDIVSALKTVFDPEIPVDIYELGLIYRIDIDGDRNVDLDMTLTAPGCPVAGDMPRWVENAVSAVPGVGQVKVNLVFDPPWEMSRMSDEAKLALNMF
jgi:FeS assembly SUF system protein